MTNETHLDPGTSTTLPSTTLTSSRCSFGRTDLSLRPVQWTDVNAVAKLIYDVCEADGDVTVATTPEDLANAWKNEGFNLERDAFLVETKDGCVVGYEDFSTRKTSIMTLMRMDTFILNSRDLASAQPYCAPSKCAPVKK
jgi:hypothetical protein